MNELDIMPALENTMNRILEFTPQMIAAMVILIIGYFLSSGIARLVRRGLQKLRLDRALHNPPAGTVISRIVESPARLTSRTTFWLYINGNSCP